MNDAGYFDFLMKRAEELTDGKVFDVSNYHDVDT